MQIESFLKAQYPLGYSDKNKSNGNMDFTN